MKCDQFDQDVANIKIGSKTTTNKTPLYDPNSVKNSENEPNSLVENTVFPTKK